MKIHEFDIAIIGGGCIGSSILFALSERGLARVGLIDHGRNARSATAHSAGMLRVFHEEPLHLDLALKNWRALESLGDVLSEKRIPNGSLYFFNRRRYQDYLPQLKQMEKAQYPFEVHSARLGRRRFPQFRWDENEYAIFEPLGSHLDPKRMSEDLLAASQNRGALVLDNFDVQHIRFHRDAYRISNETDVVIAKSLVLAGGARLLPQLAELGLSLPLEKRVLTAHLAPKLEPDQESPNFFDRETLAFARLGRGRHVILSETELPRLPKPLWENSFRILSAEDCYAPSRLGFSGQVPGAARLHLATGWGGTAFKFALEIANRVTETIHLSSPEWRNHYALSPAVI